LREPWIGLLLQRDWSGGRGGLHRCFLFYAGLGSALRSAQCGEAG
jgi:hypothetical protein